MKSYKNPAIARAMQSVQAAIPRAETDFSRPVYHFRPPAQWMNDPNGPIYHNGYYHLFYQHNPYGDEWGHTHWGHTRSKDLVYWEHLPIALWPSEEKGEDQCFSGCTVINGKGQPMIFYTSIGPKRQAYDSAQQWAALGEPDLIRWEKHPANPILTERLHGKVKIYDWRDPFIFREQDRTFMVLGGKLEKERGGDAVVLLYEAEDEELTCWKYQGILFRHPDKKLRSIECPNFFKLGDRWVLMLSPYGPVQYFVGTFDLKSLKFEPESEGLVDYSANFYATNVLFDQKGRCILFGWVRDFFEKGRGWNGCLSFPRVLSISSDGQIVQKPLPEIEKIRDTHSRTSDIFLANTSHVLKDVGGGELEILAEFEKVEAKAFGLRLHHPGEDGITIACKNGMLEVAGRIFPLRLLDKQMVRFHILIDRSVLEVYINESEVITTTVYLTPGNLDMEIFANKGRAKVKALEVWKIKPIWSKQGKMLAEQQ